MFISAKHREKLENDGFVVIDDVFTELELKVISAIIDQADKSNEAFRKSEDIFAIRRFLKEIPAIKGHVFNANLKSIIGTLLGAEYFISKAIYFDKPEKSNWFVSWHQDLTIAVNNKEDIPGFGPWTLKQNQFGVQPPVNILKENFTIRIHLDDTDAGNGALKVIPCSHLKEIYRPENIDWKVEKEVSCNVNEGGVMIMKPLLLHASERTTTNSRRRVLHIEFAKRELPKPIIWAEKEAY